MTILELDYAIPKRGGGGEFEGKEGRRGRGGWKLRSLEGGWLLGELADGRLYRSTQNKNTKQYHFNTFSRLQGYMKETLKIINEFLIKDQSQVTIMVSKNLFLRICDK